MNKSVSKSIEESVYTSLSNLTGSSPKVLLGVSGGPDSMALMYALFRKSVDTFVVHVNYGLRAEESDLDQELAEGMSAEWGFECCSVKLSTPKDLGNFQNWARNERYRIFRELKKEVDADAILTAHHEDDQVETILLKLLRGSGPESWQGLKQWNGELLRPLLAITKSDILKYCEEEAIPYRIDASNLDSDYARNFLRNELSDSFSTLFPGWKQNILQLAEKGRITEATLNYIYETLLNNGELDLETFQNLDAHLKPAILKKFIESQKVGISLSKGMINELIKIENLQTGASIKIDGNASLVKGRVTIGLIDEHESETVNLKLTKEEVREGYESDSISISFEKNFPKQASLSLNSGLLTWPLTLRSWKNGDRFVPFGMNGSQKVSDHLTNRKIPSTKKEKALILSGSDGTIYAIIFPEQAVNGEIGTISEYVRYNEATTNYLTIKLK